MNLADSAEQGFYAIVDCNSFYCSCERVFRPDLDNRPVVVLSNNDGCIISRSDEAKKLGVEMAGPYFKARPLIEQYGVTTFSSNYHLYGDLSWRVMETLRQLAGKENVEVYSVDEAFLFLPHLPSGGLYQAAFDIRETVERWTGIKVSVGVARTKVLAKLANRLAKKNKDATQCVVVLDTEEKLADALIKTPVDSIWGIGHRHAENLHRFQLHTAKDLQRMSVEWARRNLGGVTGERLIRELNGQASIKMEDELVSKKMIATTRMFGQPVHDIRDIREAIATYTSRAAEKLRRQNSAAATISVFIVPKESVPGAHYRHGPSISSYTTLSSATSVTNRLIKPAIALVNELYETGRVYKKAGVMLSGLVPDNSIQGSLFDAAADTSGRRLMNILDNVNFSMRDDVLKFASSGTKRNWKMQQNHRSPRYSTRWDEMYAAR